MRQSIYQIENRRISFCDVANITGNENVDTFHFDFDSEWDVFNDKYLVLNVDGKSYIDKLDSNNNVVLRSVAYDNDNVTFGVYGIHENAKLSTNIVWLETIPSIFGQIKEVDGVPSKTVWELYTEEMLALLAQGQITLEQCQNVLSDVQDVKALIEQLKRDVEQDKVDVTLLKSQIEASIAEINRKILAFDSNYAEKLQAFNDNFDTKLAEIVSKCDDFDEDYAEKTQNFNENVSNKTQSFNDNYTQKLGNINTAGSTQVSNVNQAGATQKANVEGAGSTAVENVNTAKTNALSAISTAESTATGNITQAGTTAVANVERAEEDAIAHIQEEGASYDERLDDLELLASNFDENTTEPSNYVTIEDALNAKAKISVLGKTKQNTYTGKNLLDRPQEYSITSNSNITSKVHITETGSYIVQCGAVTKGGAQNPYILLGNVGVSLASNTKTQITLNSIPSSCYVYSNGYDAKASLGVTSTINDLMIYPASVTDDTYEPYVGGQASPSPSYPQEMENVSGDVDVGSSTKNLFDITEYEKKFVTGKILNDNGVEVSDSGSTYSKYIIPVKANVKYYIKGAWQRMYIYNKSKEFVSRTSNTGNFSRTYEPTEDGYIGFQVSNAYWSGHKGEEQIEFGSASTSYEEHKGKTVNLTLPEGMELRSIPDTNYRDYFYKNESDGKWHYYKAIKQGTIDAANAITEYNGSYWVAFYKPEDSIMYGDFKTYRLLCECGRYASVFNTPYSYQTSISISQIGIIVKSTDTIEDIRPKINGKSYYYPLKEPIDTEITDSTLLAQLEELEQMETYKGVTHFYATSDGLAPDLKVKYLVDDRVEINSRLKALEQAVVAQNSNN